jgi:prepilin-type N-terminal cleavage/methylation domain-containing protein
MTRNPLARRKDGGFTLIELLVVIAIIGVLASVTLIAMVTYRNKALAARVEQEVASFQKAVAVYYASNLKYPNPASSNNADAACLGTSGGIYQKCCISEGGCSYQGTSLQTLNIYGDFTRAPRAPRWLTYLGERAEAVFNGALPRLLTEAPVSAGGNFQGVFYNCEDTNCTDATIYFSVPKESCSRGITHNGLTGEGMCEQNITAANQAGQNGEVCGDGTCGVGEECSDDCASETHCSDQMDNDQDSSTDGDDADCASAETDCGDLSDNDGDGYVDCEDSDCAEDPSCDPSEDCANGVDDDGDTNIDCADADCETVERCTGIEVSCDDAADNDEDTFADCDDTDCAEAENCCDICDSAGSCYDECGCYGDPYCGESSCVDGVDNDENGNTDCADATCAEDPSCAPSEAGFCADGQDNDEDGDYDCDDSECTGEPDVCDCSCDTNDCGPGTDPCYPNGDPYNCDDYQSDDPCYPNGDPYNCGDSGVDQCETNSCDISANDPCETNSCGSNPGTCYPNGGDPMNCSC